MPVRLNSTGGGSVTLDVPATAGTFTVNLPAANGDVVVTGGGSTVQFGPGSVSAPSITFSGDTNTGIYSPAADTIAFTEGGVEAMRITAVGSVGIGTASPTSRLEVLGGTIRNTLGGGGPQLLLGNSNNTVAVGSVEVSGDAALAFYTSTSSERMRIDTSGNVGIGTTSIGHRLVVSGNTTSNAYLLRANGSAPTADAAIFRPADNTLGFVTSSTEVGRFTPAGAFQVGNPSGVNTAYTADRISFNAGNYYVLNQSSVGVVLPNGNTSWSAQSDERLKDVIEPIENAASKVASLRSVIGRYKTDEPTKRRAFLIAQDVQAVLPEAVTEDDQGYLLLAYTELVPLLTAALQEALSRIETLEARLAAVEAR